MLSSPLLYNLLLVVEYEDQFWEEYSSEVFNHILIEGFFGLLFFLTQFPFLVKQKSWLLLRELRMREDFPYSVITAHLSQDSASFYMQPFSRAMQEFTLVGQSDIMTEHSSISNGAQYSQPMKTQTERSKGHQCFLLKFWWVWEFICLELMEWRWELVLSPEVCFATSVFQHHFSPLSVHYIWSSAVRQARQLGLWCYDNECTEMVATSIFRLP